MATARASEASRGKASRDRSRSRLTICWVCSLPPAAVACDRLAYLGWRVLKDGKVALRGREERNGSRFTHRESRLARPLYHEGLFDRDHVGGHSIDQRLAAGRRSGRRRFSMGSRAGLPGGRRSRQRRRRPRRCRSTPNPIRIGPGVDTQNTHAPSIVWVQDATSAQDLVGEVGVGVDLLDVFQLFHQVEQAQRLSRRRGVEGDERGWHHLDFRTSRWSRRAPRGPPAQSRAARRRRRPPGPSALGLHVLGFRIDGCHGQAVLVRFAGLGADHALGLEKPGDRTALAQTATVSS